MPVTGRQLVQPVGTAVSISASGTTAFRCALAAAALFHLAGNPSVGFGARSTALVVVQAVVGLAAMAVLLRRNRELPLVLLCLTIPVSAWFEAPMVGNHWVLATAVCLAYLSAAVVVAARGHRGDRLRTWSTFAPAGRLVLLIAYGFAAFSKLNSGFFDPVTSCAVFYQNQLASSWGVSGLSVVGNHDVGRAVAISAVVVELSVPALLLIGRTRRWGLRLAMSFHWMLAMDLAQHFWDFSAVLFTCFLIFLDDAHASRLCSIVGGLRDRVRPSVRMVLATLGLVVGLLATASGALGESPTLRGLAVLSAHLAWWVLGTATVVLVSSAVRGSGVRSRLSIRVATPLMVVVPALVLVNGLTPYLEVKTGFGWNMYSNLRTVAGQTNHLVVPRTWDLTGLQSDRVAVLRSSDKGLTRRKGYEFVWSEFREYAHDHPDVTVTYRRGGRIFASPSLADDPATSGGESEISRRLQPFRAVDVTGVERCLDDFGPAR